MKFPGGLSAFTAMDLGSVSGWGAKIPQTVHCGQKKKKKNKYKLGL